MIKRLQLILTIFTFFYFTSNSNAQGSGLSFTGGQKVTIPNSSILNLGTGAFTFEANIKASIGASSFIEVILSNRASSGGGFMLGLYNGYLFTQLGGVAPNIGSGEGVNIADGICHHVAVTRSSAGTLLFYLDGVKYYESASSVSINSTGNFLIGSDPRDASGDYFNGSIDEIRIWNVARSASDIKTYSGIPLGSGKTGLAALWDFNETTGQTVTDNSANAINGTLGTTQTVESTDPVRVNAGCVFESAPGKGLAFNGAQRVTTPYSSLLNLGTGPFTFEANIKAFSGTDYVQVLLSNRVAGGGGFMLGLLEGYLYTQLGGNVPNIGYDKGINIADNKCHHVALTRNAAGLLQFYLDGKIYYEQTNAININTNQGFTLGFDRVDASGDYFKGIIDEVRIWNVQRSASDIKAYYNSPLGTFKTGLVALWNLNEGTGQVVADASGNGINGTLGLASTVENSDPLWTSSDCSAAIVAGTDEKALNSQFAVYPNPFDDKISISSSAQVVKASLYSATGEQVMSEVNVISGSDLNIDKSLLPGIYFLKLSDGTTFGVRKMIKK